MNDAEKVQHLEAMLNKYDEAINDEENGERPFNESGELIEALWSLVNEDKERLIKVGWITQ